MVLVVPLIWIAMSQAATTTLAGTVNGPDGKPVAGADVLLAGMPVYDPPILARARSDAEGRFSIERPVGLAPQTRFIAPILWVMKPGFRLSYTRFSGPMPGPDEPVRIVLRPPGRAEVRVEGPERQPLAGARVRVEGIGRVSINVPDPVADLTEAITDKDGLATLDAASNDELEYVNVHSREFGIQGACSRRGIRCRSSSRFAGRPRSRAASWPTTARCSEGGTFVPIPVRALGRRVPPKRPAMRPRRRMTKADSHSRRLHRRPPARAQAAHGLARPARSSRVIESARSRRQFAGDPSP